MMASIGNLTGKKVVMHMHFNSDTYEERVRAHGILHQPETRKDGSSMVVLESCVNNFLKLGPALLAVGALTNTDGVAECMPAPLCLLQWRRCCVAIATGAPWPGGPGGLSSLDPQATVHLAIRHEHSIIQDAPKTLNEL